MNMQNDGMYFNWNLFRRDVRTDIRNCALFLLFFYAVNLLASEIVMFMGNPSSMDLVYETVRSASQDSGGLSAADVQKSMDGFFDPSGNLVGLATMIGIVAGGLVFLIPRKRRFFTDIMLPASEPMTPKIFIILIVLTQCVQIVYGLITTLIDYLLPQGLSLQENYSDAMDSLFTPIGILYVVLVGPIFEELIFRGAIMGTLRRFGENFAILFSSLLFGFYHMLILQIPFAFVLGLLLGYVASRWSLRASIALHIVVNGLSTLLSDFGNESFLDIGAFAMIGCAIATLVMAIKWRKQFWVRVRAGAPYYERTYSNGFSSITLWVFMAIMTGVGLLLLSLPMPA